MSYGGGRRSSFGGKGAAQKKDRKKKQEFHRHKVKYVEEQNIDFEHLKQRVNLSLDKLRQQVFSTEPGGYSLQDWMKSFNFLLDDFEEKAGATNLPKEYFDKRLELSAELLKPVDTSDLDLEIEKTRSEGENIRTKIFQENAEKKRAVDEERSRLSLRIDSLREEHAECLKQIESETKALEHRRRNPPKSASFFKRILSNSSDPSSPDAISRRIRDLEAKLKKIEEETHILQEERNSKSLSNEISGELQTQGEVEILESIETKLGELDARRSERIQLSERRKQVTDSMSEVISKINLGSKEESTDSMETNQQS